MKVPLTKWFISVMVLVVISALAIPSSSCGFGNRITRLSDDPNEPQPEGTMDSRPVLLVEDCNEPQPEFAPFESGKTYLEEEPEDPQPESFEAYEPILLDAEPNEPQPESC